MRSIFTFVLGLLLTLSVAPCGLFAGDARVAGGLSPNGKLEVVAVDLKDPATPEFTYEFVLRDIATKKVLTKVSLPGYAFKLQAAVDNEFAKNSAVLWNPASSAFAFNVRDTKRSRSTQVFTIKSGSWEQVSLKDPFPVVLKDLGISEVDRCAYLDPMRWDVDDAIVLQASGDCVTPLRGTWFEYEVRCHLADPGKFEVKLVSLKDHNG